jgi:hypothetical protein
VKGILAIAAVILLTLSLASVAIAQEKANTIDYALKGKVVSVNPLSQTMTVEPTSSLSSAGGAMSGFTFTVSEMTNVRMCEQDRTVKDIKVGETVTVVYHKEAGTLYADVVDIPTPLVACLLD